MESASVLTLTSGGQEEGNLNSQEKIDMDIHDMETTPPKRQKV
jgi:hypothetical protein